MGARHGDTAANHADLQSGCGRTCVFAVQLWSNLWDLIWLRTSHYSMDITMICNNFGIYFPLEEWLIILCSVQNDLDYSALNGRVIPPLTCNECLKFSQIMIFCCAENCAEQKLKSSKSNKFMSLFPIVIWKLYAVHLSFSVMMKLNVYLYLWKCPSLHFLYIANWAPSTFCSHSYSFGTDV